MKVYVHTQGYEFELDILDVYSSKVGAETIVKKYGGDIIEFELDDPKICIESFGERNDPQNKV